MSIPYVRGSLKNIDTDGDGIADSLQFKLQNNLGTGSVYISNLRILVDGKDYTESTTFKIGDKAPRPATNLGYVYSNYGDEILVEVKHKGEIKPGKHRIVISVQSDMGPYTISFEDTT
ncbi:MAG: hypothetical protein J7J99_06135 [Thermoprotei archaeon]|nr:hypothetical protein [Thermoprotei archaeon]